MIPQANYDQVPGGYAQGAAGVQLQGVKRWMGNWKLLDRQYEQGGWKSLHQDLAQYICLGRGRFVDRGQQPNANSRAATRVVNNCATDALHMLGAGMHGGLSSPARPWFKLGFQDPILDKSRQYRNWMDDSERALYAFIRRANFYNNVHHLYEEQGGFGSGAMFVDAHRELGVTFTVMTAGDYRFSVRTDGRLHTLMRYFRMQAASMAQEFGVEKMSERSKRLLRTNPFEWVDVYHCLEPNEQHDPGKMGSFAWVSAYFEANREDESRTLSYGGYHECPAVTPRWMPLANEAYSWGPGPESLQSVKALQKMELASIKAADKMIDPPTRNPPSMRDRMLDLSPGGKNIVDEADGKIEPIFLIDPAAMQRFEEKVGSIENRIRNNFYNQIFLMISNLPPGGDKVTAAEIIARNQEKMLMLGPVIESQEYEFLGPIISRVWGIAARSGYMPPPPPDLQNVEYKIDFVSILAQAQKLLSMQGMGNYLATAERVAMVDPRSVAKTNWHIFLEETAEAVGAPARILNDEDTANQILARADAQLAQQQQLAAGAAEVDARTKLANAPAASDDNALGQMESQAGGE